MTNLERLISFWNKIYDEGNADLPPNILTHILATIGALAELKELKELQR